MEIPGFYRDPRSGKYYRINEQDPNVSSFLLKNKSAQPELSVSSEPIQILNLLQDREIGALKYSLFENSFLKLKLERMNDFKKNVSSDRRKTLLDIAYVKGGNEKVLGLWCVGDYSVLGEVSHHSVTVPHFKSIRIPLGFIDFCEGWASSNCVMVLSNHIDTNQGLIEFYFSNVECPDSRKRTQSTLFCCSSNSVRQHFVVGGENLIMLLSLDMHLYDRRVKGSVRSVQFSEERDIIYSGVHCGNLLTIDLRQPRYNKKKLFKCGVDEILLLPNKNDLICGSFDGELCKLDIRTMKKVTEYYGHVHTPKKVPFSVDHSMNLLCATGSDNVSRLWSLDGGNYIKTLEPPFKKVPHRAWLVSDANSRMLYVVQRDKTYYIDF